MTQIRIKLLKVDDETTCVEFTLINGSLKNMKDHFRDFKKEVFEIRDENDDNEGAGPNENENEDSD